MNKQTNALNENVNISFWKDDSGVLRAFSFGTYKSKTARGMENHMPTKTELIGASTQVTTERTQRLANRAKTLKAATEKRSGITA